MAIWDVQSGEKRVVARLGTADATGVDIQPRRTDGVSFPRLDGRVRLVPANGDGPVTILRGHEEQVWAARFSRDGHEGRQR